MRFASPLALALLAFGSPLTSASPNPLPVGTTTSVAVPLSTASADTSSLAKVSSELRDVKAPEVPELTGENFHEKIAKGYW